MYVSPDFEKWKQQARELPRSELTRHASVSIGNRHACKSCFTCACAEVLRESPIRKDLR
jgi:hypothetical protein